LIGVIHHIHRQVATGTSFEVPKNASFKLKVKEVLDYCCSYY
jgi:uncharacterized protein YaiE (UPF0345 family)